ncbi:hypothetical protein [Duncaniella muricolitica]|jgi:transcriptional regulator with XRE-family HTH domain|uniref:hypothetical protein n=1 Tax=Duncaniella muricolitica TaxID=2880704 RepID=UPI00244E53BA|nr:hypothetical protein [Duncaniella muricolitica]
MDNRVNRIKDVLEWLKSSSLFRSNREIAERMGYNPSMVSQVITGRSSVTQKFVRSLSSVCPRINYDWIWTGEGDMLREVLSSGALPADRLSELDRFSFIMSEMAQLMKNFSSVVCPLERRVAELERRVAEQNNTIDQLRLRLDRMEKAATP